MDITVIGKYMGEEEWLGGRLGSMEYEGEHERRKSIFANFEFHSFPF